MTSVGTFRKAYFIALIALSVLIVARCFLVYNDGFRHAGVSFDEPSFVWGGWCILKGLAPYRDFLEFKPPLIFLTHALAFALHGFKNFGFRQFFAYAPLASILCVHLALLTRRVNWVLALTWSLAVIELWLSPSYHDTALSDTESIGLMYYFFAIAFLVVRTPYNRVTKGLAAASFVCCILAKEPFLPCVGLTWLVGFLLDDEKGAFGPHAKRYFKASLIGGSVVAVALCLYMVPTGSMSAYLRMLRGYFTIYRDPQLSYCVVLGRFHPTTRWNDALVQWEQAKREFVNVSVLGYLAPLAALAAAGMWRRSKIMLLGASLGCIAALNAVTASNCQWTHYYNMAESGIFFFLAAGLIASAPAVAAMSRSMSVALRYALLLGVLMKMQPRYEKEAAAMGTRTFSDPYAEQVPGSLEAIARYTKPSDRIFTTGIPILYIQANRISGVRESQWTDEILGVYPGNTDEERLSDIRAQLERTRPKIMIMDPSYGDRKVRHMRVLFTPYLKSHGYTEIKPHIFLRPD